MRVLVTWGSRHGGTEGIARIVVAALERDGFEVDALPSREVGDLTPFDAVIVGGALYANRWHPDAARFVRRHVAALRRVPVWLFSSGPLDDTAGPAEIPPTRQVEVLMARVGAIAHRTFGGRLEPDVKGFPASAMAKDHAGDWRDRTAIDAWATAVGRALPDALPGVAVDPPGGSLVRLVAHGIVGWAACAVVMATLLHVSVGVAYALHAIAVPLVFVAVSRRYFRLPGAREPLPTAIAFAGLFLALDAVVVAGVVYGDAAIFASVAATWLPVALAFLATWGTGATLSMMPVDLSGPGAEHPRAV